MKTTFSNSSESCLHWNRFDTLLLLCLFFTWRKRKAVIKHLVSIQSREVVEIHVKKRSVCEEEHMCCERPTETDLCGLSSFPKCLCLGTSLRFSPNVPLFQQWNYTVVQVPYFIRFCRIFTQPKQKQKSTLYFPGKKQANLIWNFFISFTWLFLNTCNVHMQYLCFEHLLWD